MEKNDTKAAELFRKSADRGYPLAQYNLAACYESGRGVEKDLSKAVALYRKAAVAGMKQAQMKLKNPGLK